MFVPKRIILHCSATKDGLVVDWQAIRRYHLSNSWTDIGYHFGIELVNGEYEILVGRQMTVQGAHTSGENSDSLGICCVGDFDKVAPPAQQWQLALKLVRSLQQVFSIPTDRVYGHREFTNLKTCPGKMFDLSEFRRQL